MAKLAKIAKTTDTYVDAQGNKVVQPVYNGNGGTASGVMIVTRTTK